MLNLKAVTLTSSQIQKIHLSVKNNFKGLSREELVRSVERSYRVCDLSTCDKTSLKNMLWSSEFGERQMEAYSHLTSAQIKKALQE